MANYALTQLTRAQFDTLLYLLRAETAMLRECYKRGTVDDRIGELAAVEAEVVRTIANSEHLKEAK